MDARRGLAGEHHALRRRPALAQRHVEGAQAHISSTYTSTRVVEQWNRVFESLLGETATNV